MSAPTTFLSRQARIVISPKPSTLTETSAILKALQSFGPVLHFLNPRYVPGLKTQSQTNFYVNFKGKESLDKVLAASPLTVEVGHDDVDPEEDDPFNVRGFWGRKRMERKTFTCAVFDNARDQGHNSTWDRQMIEANPYYGSFRVDSLGVGFQDLMSQGAPSPGFADCFQKRHLSEGNRTKLEEVAQPWSFYTTADDGEVGGGLMDAWRKGLESKTATGQIEAEQGQSMT